MAGTQASRSASRDRRNDVARYAASWVLPHPPGQSRTPPAASPPARATEAPGTSVASRPGTVSVLAMKPSARGGTRPDRTGHVPLLAGPAGGWPTAGINP